MVSVDIVNDEILAKLFAGEEVLDLICYLESIRLR